MKFRSCYVEEVEMNQDGITLVDSHRNRFRVDSKNRETVDQFKTWFQEVFKTGLTQYLTVFQYRTDSDPDDPGVCVDVI